jgi:hypothetical protein
MLPTEKQIYFVKLDDRVTRVTFKFKKDGCEKIHLFSP